MVCRKQMRSDMDRELEGAGDNTKSDNVTGSSLLERLHRCRSGAAAIIVGSSRLTCGGKKIVQVEAPLFER